jgi:actin-related protein
MRNSDIVNCVLDVGSFETKSGFAGEDQPRSTFTTIVGRRKDQISPRKSKFIGSTVFSDMEELNISCPIVKGTYHDMEGLNLILEHSFDELNVSSSVARLLICESLDSIPKQKEKLTEILFEKLSIPFLGFQRSPLLSLYATGRITGTVIEAGHTITTCCSVLEGKLVLGGKNGKQSSMFGGYDVTRAMMTALNFENSLKMEKIAMNIKHLYGSFTSHDDVEYELPDGTILKIDGEYRKLGNILFDGTDLCVGIKEMTINAIENIDEMSLRRETANSVICCGGSALLHGFSEKARNSIEDYFIKTNVIEGYDPKYLSWVGGSMVSNLSSFDSYLSSQQYKEEGSKAIFPFCQDNIPSN